jgi:hypothetical protein
MMNNLYKYLLLFFSKGEGFAKQVMASVEKFFPSNILKEGDIPEQTRMDSAKTIAVEDRVSDSTERITLVQDFLQDRYLGILDKLFKGLKAIDYYFILNKNIFYYFQRNYLSN